MIKFVVLCTKIIVVAIAALLFTSCKFDFGNGIDGNGDVKTETRTINEKFTKIEASRGIEVIVEQSETTSVEVEADSNLLQHITTKVVNGTLEITSDENIDSAEAETVRVKMPIIEGLSSTSGSNIHTNNVLRGTAIKMKSSSGSELDATLEFEDIDLESTSGSTATLSGKALKFSSRSSSGSEINASKLEANDVFAEATSGSSSDVNAIVSINAKASSGSSIDYKGKPKNIVKEETSGASVSAN
jgi:hypothetical protein